MQDIGQMPSVQKAHAAQGAETYTTTPAETDAAFKREVEVYSEVVKRADLN
jgi:tripartite-type tricarboxylate transporter receptor subunit TctC